MSVYCQVLRDGMVNWYIQSISLIMRLRETGKVVKIFLKPLVRASARAFGVTATARRRHIAPTEMAAWRRQRRRTTLFRD